MVDDLKITGEHITTRKEIVGSSGEKVDIIYSDEMDIVMEIVI